MSVLPGNPYKAGLPDLTNVKNIELTELEILLIQHAYDNKYERIIIEKEFGEGYSQTRVFLVLPIKPGGESDAHVVTKIGPKSELQMESQNYNDFVKGSLPFCAAQVFGYYEQGEMAAVNYAFAGGGSMGKTLSLEEYYSNHTAEQLKATLINLLDKDLGARWYAQSRSLTCLFRDEYGRHLPEHDELEKVVDVISRNVSSTSNPAQIDIPALSTAPHPLKIYPDLLNATLRERRSLVHGDLHPRNVLVDETGKGWLIDFAKTKTRHNLFDFIKLETYIRIMILAPLHIHFSWIDYVEFELALNAQTLGQKVSMPANTHLAKAFTVIYTIRSIAHKYMENSQSDFKKEYFPALLLYCLAMLKYYESQGVASAQAVFLTAYALAASLEEKQVIPQISKGKPAKYSNYDKPYDKPKARFVVGRKKEVERFADLAQGKTPYHILNIYGPGGIGKTVVGQKMREFAVQNKIPFVLIEGDRPDLTPDRILYTIKQELVQTESLAPSFDSFEREYKDYQFIQDVLRRGGGVHTLFDTIGNVQDPAGFGQIIQALGKGITVTVQQNLSNRFALERYLRGVEKMLTSRLSENIADAVQKSGQTPVILFDTYEEMEGLDDWICQVMMPTLPDKVRLVVLGRNALPKVNFDWSEFESLFDMELDELLEADAKMYLAHFGLQDTVAQDQIYRFTGGYPLLLVLVRYLAQEAGGWDKIGSLENLSSRDEIATQLLQRILREERVAEVQAFLEKGAVARWFNPEIIGLLLEINSDDARKIYDKLRRHSFVERHEYGLKFHDKIRELLRDRLKFTSQSEYDRLVGKLTSYYREQAELDIDAES